MRLGPLGEALESDRRIARRGAAAGGTAEQHVSQAVELDAFAVGSRIGVAWVMDFGHHLSVQSAYSVDGGTRFAAVEELGETVRLDPGTRGRLAMSGTTEGRLLLQHRVTQGDCVSSAGRCARIQRTSVGGDGPGPRGGIGLEVRTPCDPLISSALFRDGSLYYSLCHEEEEVGPSATIYTIRSALSWAGTTALEGCRPVATAPIDRGVVVVSRCGEDLVATRLDEMGREVDTYRPVERVAECQDGRPVLRVREGNREAKLRLGAAVDHIEGLLPEDIAPDGSRAIWTGEAILVGVPRGHELTLRRYQCLPDGRLDRTDVR